MLDVSEFLIEKGWQFKSVQGGWKDPDTGDWLTMRDSLNTQIKRDADSISRLTAQRDAMARALEAALPIFRAFVSGLREDCAPDRVMAPAQQALDLVALALSPAGASGWMPIANAPKDGHAILVYPVGIFGADQPGIAFWDRDAGYESWRDLEGERVEDLTHWQPLPLPPADCDHHWIDMQNEAIRSGELCEKCGAIRAGNPPQLPTPAAYAEACSRWRDAILKKEAPDVIAELAVRLTEMEQAYSKAGQAPPGWSASDDAVPPAGGER